MSAKTMKNIKNAPADEKLKDNESHKIGKSTKMIEKKKKNGKKPRQTYKLYIFKVLKGIHNDIGISNKAMEIMNEFIKDMFEKISQEASELAKQNNKKTMSSSDIETSVKLVLNGELAKQAVCEGSTAVENFTKF